MLGLGLALWSAGGRPRWLILLLCYFVALCITELLLRFEWLPPLPGRAFVALGVLLALPGIGFGYAARARMLEDAGLVGLSERVGDRVRLAREPAIAPALVSSAQPQTFFVHAPNAREVSLQLGAAVKPVVGERMGHGLFRLDYDPRVQGRPSLADGVLGAQLLVDGVSHARDMRVVTPLVHPRWFCRSPSGVLAATPSEETDELIVVGGSKPLRLPVADGPIDCAFLDETHVAVTHRHVDALWLLDLARPEAAERLPLPGPLGRLARDPVTGGACVARGGAAPQLLHVRWPELALQEVTPLPAAGEWLGFAAPDRLLVASRADASVHAFTRQGARFTPAGTLPLSRPAASFALDPAHARLFVTVTDYRTEPGAQLGNHFVQDQLLVVDSVRLEVLQRVRTARRSERQTKPGDMDQGGSPLGVWPLADGRLALAFAGTDELWRLPLPAGEPERVRFEDVQFYAPHGVTELADGTLWLSSPAAGALARIAPGAHAGVIVPLAPDDHTLLAQHPLALQRRIGERGFYESTRGGIACQSCHMHADNDGSAYNLGDHRLVPNLSVRGLLGTAPYLRDGSYPRISDLDEVAETLYRGYVRVQPGRRACLQAFIESLPRMRTAAARDPEAERRGLAAFVRAGCERCHSFPAFTNLGLLPLAALFPDVARAQTQSSGAGESVDVPSLLSVSTSAPYLNDGRASDLASVLDQHNRDNLHGDTRSLSEGERADLVRFLASL